MQLEEKEGSKGLKFPESNHNKVLVKPNFDEMPQSNVKDRIKDFLSHANSLSEHMPSVSEPIVFDTVNNYSASDHDESLGVVMDILAIGSAEVPEES